MSLFTDLLNRTTNKIESKVVGNRVKKAIESIDTVSLEKCFTTSSDSFNDILKSGGDLILSLISENKKDMIHFAENNSNKIIKFADLLNEMKDVITSLDSDMNRRTLNSMKKTSLDIANVSHNELQSKMRTHEKECNTAWDKVGTSCGFDMSIKYSILVDNELTPVTEEHFNEHKRNVIHENGSFYSTSIAKEVYEITKDQHEIEINSSSSRRS